MRLFRSFSTLLVALLLTVGGYAQKDFTREEFLELHGAYKGYAKARILERKEGPGLYRSPWSRFRISPN